MSPREPRLATWILEHCISDYRCESFIGDLIEQYPERGGWWYWLQALDAIRARTIRTAAAATRPEGSAAEVLEDQFSWIALNAWGYIQAVICIGLLLSRTHLANSSTALLIGAAVTAGAVNCAAGAAHVIRMSVPR